jgi:hypothetical protein
MVSLAISVSSESILMFINFLKDAKGYVFDCKRKTSKNQVLPFGEIPVPLPPGTFKVEIKIPS